MWTGQRNMCFNALPENCIKFHWPIKDPKTAEEFQSARDDIKHVLKKFLEEL